MTKEICKLQSLKHTFLFRQQKSKASNGIFLVSHKSNWHFQESGRYFVRWIASAAAPLLPPQRPLLPLNVCSSLRCVECRPEAVAGRVPGWWFKPIWTNGVVKLGIIISKYPTSIIGINKKNISNPKKREKKHRCSGHGTQYVSVVHFQKCPAWPPL
jgi:hypothetical protein